MLISITVHHYIMTSSGRFPPQCGLDSGPKFRAYLMMSPSGYTIRCVLARVAWRVAFHFLLRAEREARSDVLPAPRCGGGGGRFCPCRIFSIAQKRQQIWTRNFLYFFQHQFDVYHQILRKIRQEMFLIKWRFRDVMFRDFSSKCGTSLKASRMYRLEAKHNP